MTYEVLRRLGWVPVAAVRPVARPALELTWRLRRWALIVGVRFHAALVDAHVDLEIASDVQLGRRVKTDIQHGTRSRLAVGSGARIQDDVVFWLRGGSVEVGADAELRRGSAMDSSGVLRIGGGVMLGRGATLHCAEQLTIGPLTVVAEYATITDSRHLRTSSGVNLLHHVKTAPTCIGRGAWIGAHASVVSGVTVGDNAFVGAGAVVTKDVPEGWLVGGNPAHPLRRLEVEPT